MELNEDQRRSLLATLSYVDSLLVAVADDASAPRSPFAPRLQDLSPDVRRDVLERVSGIRRHLLDMLGRLGLAAPPATIKASWSMRGALSLARIALLEASPARLRACGALDEDSAMAVAQAEAGLTGALDELDAWLAAAAGQDRSGGADGLHPAE